jgi:large subunit ribosomal protein L10
MLKEVKEENIAALRLELAKATSLIVADFRGITVKNDTSLRREFRANGCQYQVVKNTLLGIAIKGTPMSVIDSILAGPTAIAYSYEDPAAPAKVAAKIAKQEEKFIIKGGYVDGKALDRKGVEALSTLPGRDELRATFLATLLAVPQNFLRLTTAAQQNFALLLAARERALEESGKGGAG